MYMYIYIYIYILFIYLCIDILTYYRSNFAIKREAYTQLLHDHVTTS